MRGFFQNCGQNCIGLERLVVQDTIYDRVVDELTKRVRGLRQVRRRDQTRPAPPPSRPLTQPRPTPCRPPPRERRWRRRSMWAP